MEPITMIAVSGGIGGLIKSLVEQKGAVALPRIEIGPDGTRYVHLGGVTNLIIGGVMAVLTATDPVTAIGAGISSAFLAEKVFERANELPLPIKGTREG